MPPRVVERRQKLQTGSKTPGLRHALAVVLNLYLEVGLPKDPYVSKPIAVNKCVYMNQLLIRALYG